MSTPRAVILGAGLSGLTAGVLLARAGWSVTILESHRSPGGLLQRFRRGPLHLDTGFHFVTGGGPGGLFRRMLSVLGVREQVDFAPLDHQAQFHLHDQRLGEVTVPVGFDRCEQHFATLWPDQAAALHRFFARVRQSLRLAPWLEPLGRHGPDTGRLDLDGTAGAEIAQAGVNGLAAEVLRALTAVLGMDADRLPLHAYAVMAASAMDGSYRLEKGGDGLVGPLVARFQHLGGCLRCGCGAARIHHLDQQVTGVEDVHGHLHTAEVVIASCHPQEVLRITGPEGFRPGFLHDLAACPDGQSAFVLHVRLARPLPEAGQRHHLIQLADGSKCYAVLPGNFHPHEPPYAELMQWMPGSTVATWAETRHGSRPSAYHAWKEATAATLLAEIDRFLPGLAQATTGRRWTFSPLTLRDYVRTRGGAALGLAHDVAQRSGHPVRIRNKLRNLLFAGQSTSHAGILGTLVGAFELVGHLTGHPLEAETLAADGD